MTWLPNVSELYPRIEHVRKSWSLSSSGEMFNQIYEYKIKMSNNIWQLYIIKIFRGHLNNLTENKQIRVFDIIHFDIILPLFYIYSKKEKNRLTIISRNKTNSTTIKSKNCGKRITSPKKSKSSHMLTTKKVDWLILFCDFIHSVIQ